MFRKLIILLSIAQVAVCPLLCADGGAGPAGAKQTRVVAKTCSCGRCRHTTTLPSSPAPKQPAGNLCQCFCSHEVVVAVNVDLPTDQTTSCVLALDDTSLLPCFSSLAPLDDQARPPGIFPDVERRIALRSLLI